MADLGQFGELELQETGSRWRVGSQVALRRINNVSLVRCASERSSTERAGGAHQLQWDSLRRLQARTPPRLA